MKINLLIKIIKPLLPLLLIAFLLFVLQYNFNIKQNKNLVQTASYSYKINQELVNAAKKFATTYKSVYDFSHNNLITKNNFYKVDCAGFIKLILMDQNLINPLKEIIDFIPTNFVPSIINKTPSPTHYSFFMKNKNNKTYWYVINDVLDLMPGDFIIYTKHSNQTPQAITEYGQHIMLVADTPKKNIISINGYSKEILWIPIFDSTKRPHGNSDDREHTNTNAIGKGIIGLVLENNNRSTKLIWKDYSNSFFYLTNKNVLNRDILLARIIKN